MFRNQSHQWILDQIRVKTKVSKVQSYGPGGVAWESEDVPDHI